MQQVQIVNVCFREKKKFFSSYSFYDKDLSNCLIKVIIRHLLAFDRIKKCRLYYMYCFARIIYMNFEQCVEKSQRSYRLDR